MNLPIKIDLYLASRLPGYDLEETVIPVSSVGGNPKDITDHMNNRIYKFLLTKENSEINLAFEFDNNLNILEENTYSKFMELNQYTAMFGLKYLKQKNSTLDLPRTNLVMRCFDQVSNDDLEDIIKKWKDDKRNFSTNIINIFLYGTVYNGEVPVSNYILSKKYHNYQDILKLDENMSIIYISRLIEFLNELHKLNMVYRDLQFYNIGYDKLPNGIINFVVLNYNNLTLLNLNDKFFESFKLTGCNSKYCGGTLIPYYVVKDFFYSNSKWLPRLDKLYSLGLAEIIICMFFKDNQTFHELYKLLSGIASLNSSLYYHHLITIFDDNIKYDRLIELINNLDCRFPKINPLVEKMLKQIVVNLFSKNYNDIYLPGQIIDLMNKILPSNDEFDNKQVSTLKPIGSYPVYKVEPTQVENELLKLSKKDIKMQDIRKMVFVGGSIDSEINPDYKKLYLKYKSKYLKLKNNL